MISSIPKSVLFLLLFATAGICQNPSVKAGEFIIVGMGTAPDLMTLRARKVVAQADILLAEEGAIKAIWADLAEGKEVWEWPHSLRKFFGANVASILDSERKAEVLRLDGIRQDLAAKIAAAVRSGKTVACLQSGDPMMYGMTLFLEILPKDVPTSVVPGIGAFQAASAALKYSPPYGFDTSAVILTMDDWPGRLDLNEKLMAAGSSMVFYTMNMDYPRLLSQLKRFYPPDTPIAAVCDAGDPIREKVVRSTLSVFSDGREYESLPANRHMLFVGKFLKVGQARKDFVPSVATPVARH